MKNAALILLFALFFLGCVKEKTADCTRDYKICYLKARVILTSDITCYTPVLDFSEDSSRIRLLTKINSLTYNAINLPVNYLAPGQKLFVSVTGLTPQEEFPCNTLGIALPRLKITDAKERP